MICRVLLSTYQGERFLRQQLDSLLAQTYAPLQIAVRDDGSTDGTGAILAAYAERHPERICVTLGPRIGFVRSFFELLKDAGGAPYVAFCDQDDVWHPDKIAAAVAALALSGRTPALYTCRYSYIDASGRVLGDASSSLSFGFARAMFQNAALGCTIVMNRSARDLLVDPLPDLSWLPLHDWWAFLVVSACGDVHHDPAIRQLYRQHDANAVGESASDLATVVRRVSDVLSGRRARYPQRRVIEELLRCHERRMRPAAHAEAEAFLHSTASATGRVAYALAPGRRRPSLASELLWRLKIAMNLL